MKTLHFALTAAFVSTAAVFAADPPIIVVRPAAPVVVPAPTIPSTSASNQAVMTQIINRLNQSRTNHNIAIATTPRVVTPVVQPTRVEVRKTR